MGADPVLSQPWAGIAAPAMNMSRVLAELSARAPAGVGASSAMQVSEVTRVVDSGPALPGDELMMAG